MNYTKGEWKAQRINGDWEVVSPEFQIAHVCNYGIAKKLDIAPANARLIAAAPEMYEQLLRVNEWLELNKLNQQGMSGKLLHISINKILTKAEGGEEKFEPVVGPDPRD